MSGNNITNSPSDQYVAITPGASVLYPAPRALYVGATQDVTVEDFYGNTVAFVGVQGGSVLPIACKKVTIAAGGSIVGLI